jgi:hypothetical protein
MNAFDACETPTVDQMAAWRQASPYRAVGIYIGGSSRACANPALDTSAWVNAVVAQGWKLIPTYVGAQAPCTTFVHRMSDTNAVAEGAAAADDAVARARIAGIGTGAPIYIDIEHYVGDAGCSAVVRAFLGGWTARLHQYGFRAGLYGNPGSAISAAADAAWLGELPVDSLWIAAWTGTPTLTGFAGLPDTSWSEHQRIHQWGRDHPETWGGVTLNIDSSFVDGLVAP